MTITHIPGKTNTVADVLSRLYETSKTDTNEPPDLPNFPASIKFSDDPPGTSLPVITMFSGPARILLDDWTEDYKADPAVSQAYFDAATGALKADKKRCFKYGRLWHDDKIVVPLMRVNEIISSHHDSIVAGHWGIHRTVSLIRRRFVFPRMRLRVRQHVSSCDACQHAKSDRHRPMGLMENVSLPVHKWQAIGMDWILGLPPVTKNGILYEHILMVTDRATKMVHLIPTFKTADAVDTAQQFLTYVVKYHGLPRSIISDRDRDGDEQRPVGRF